MASNAVESTLALHTEQILQLLREFVRLKPRLTAVLPEDMARLKDRLSEFYPEGKPRRATDHDLFYRIGVVLSREQEPLTMSALGEALAVPLSTATRLVDWLVESEYAARLPDPEDRRIVRVALTETGKALLQTVQDVIRHRIAQALRRFTPEEREQLIALMRKGVAVLEEV